MKKSIIINIALLSSLSMAESAFNLEQEKVKLANKVFNHYDINHNKTLSCDKDKNSKLSRDEAKAGELSIKFFERYVFHKYRNEES